MGALPGSGEERHGSHSQICSLLRGGFRAPERAQRPNLHAIVHFFFVMASDFMASSDLAILSFFVASAFMASSDLPMLLFFMASDFIPSDFIPSPDLPMLSCAWAAPAMAASESARARKRLRVEGVMTYLGAGRDHPDLMAGAHARDP